MNHKTIIICRGLQGSGKTTWAKDWVSKDPEHRIRYNSGDIINMLSGVHTFSIINSAERSILMSAMNTGYDIVIDDINLDSSNHEAIRTMIANYERGWHQYDYFIQFQDFPTPLEECIRRDNLRPNPVGKETIIATYNKYKEKYQWL